MQGNLKDVSTTQILNIINLARKTGTLLIYEARRTGQMEQISETQRRERIVPGEERARVAFREGKLIYARMDGHDGSLVTVLNRAGKLTDEQARVIRERARRATDKAIALRLIGADYVTQRDIIASVQHHMMNVIFNLMGWHEEPFRFVNNALPNTSARIMVPMDLEYVILEGTKVLDKIEEMNHVLPSLDRSLVFPKNFKERFKGIHLNVEEWRVISFVNPKNTIRQIARANNMSDIEIRKIVYGLLQAGLIELVPAPRPTAQRRAAGGQLPVSRPQADVVNKLINKIKSM